MRLSKACKFIALKEVFEIKKHKLLLIVPALAVCLLIGIAAAMLLRNSADSPMSGEKIKNLCCITEQPTALEKVEYMLYLPEIEGNPYDDGDISLVMTLKGPSGSELNVIGFYYVPYEKESGFTVASKSEEPHWRFRFSPPSEGRWRVSVTLKVNNKAAEVLKAPSLMVERATDTSGFIGVEPNHRQTFCFSDGKPFIAIGQNVAWSNGTQYDYYVKQLRSMAKGGCNFVRIWLTQWDLSLLTAKCAPDDLSGGMQRAAALDGILSEAERLGIYIELCFLHHGQFSTLINPVWDDCAFNSKNSGYLSYPTQFFSDKRALEDTRDYFRYIIARWSYSPHIMGWQLFNEADLTEHNLNSLYTWHEEMCEYVRSIDWQRHLIASSTANRAGVSTLKCFDYIAVHWYGYNNSVINLAYSQETNHKTFRKPVIFDEAGCDNAEGRNVDELLVSVHQQNWIGVMGGGAGVAANWYWQESSRIPGYFEGFEPLKSFASRIPWGDKKLITYYPDDLKDSSKQVFAMGYGSKDYSYLWLLDGEYNNKTKKETTFSDYEISLPLGVGSYKAEWIDTRSGETLRVDSFDAKGDKYKLSAPVFTKDIAVAVTRDMKN